MEGPPDVMGGPPAQAFHQVQVLILPWHKLCQTDNNPTNTIFEDTCSNYTISTDTRSNDTISNGTFSSVAVSNETVSTNTSSNDISYADTSSTDNSSTDINSSNISSANTISIFTISTVTSDIDTSAAFISSNVHHLSTTSAQEENHLLRGKVAELEKRVSDLTGQLAPLSFR